MQTNLLRNLLRLILLSTAFLFGILVASYVHGQVSPEEHAKHHPEQAQENADPSPQGSGTKNSPSAGPGEKNDEGGMMGGGMMSGGMGGMMDKMGAPKPKEMYPQLMDFPTVSPEQRKQIQEEAHKRMVLGTSLLSSGLDDLSTSAPTDDFAAMQTATSKMREGLAQFESGLAAHRAIAEGKSPQNVALQWFKREMNLLPPASTNAKGFTLFGMGLLHSLTMLGLSLFSVAMVWMYFFKMRRAAALLERLATDSVTIENVSVDSDTRLSSQASTSTELAKVATESTAAVAAKGCCDDTSSSCADECGENRESDTAENGKADLSAGILSVAKRKLCKLRVAKIYQETDDVKTFRLVACHGGPIPFSYLPGQFLTLTMPTGEKPIRRSYTIASAPTQGYYCEITVKRENKGAGSRYLHDSINEGDTLEVQAPSGKFVFTGKEADDIVLISGGVGITPMMSIARALTDMGWPGQIYFIVACRDHDHFIFESELKQLQKRHSNLHVCAAMSQLKKSELENPVDEYRVGRLNHEMFTDWVPDFKSKRIHICGPVPMMDAMKSLLIEMGVSKGNVHTENFGSQAKPKNKSRKSKSKSTKRKQVETKANGKTTATVEFSTSQKSTSIDPDETLLEAAERIDVDIDNSCRVGMCGVCAVKVLSGKAIQDVDDGLDPDDKAAGKVLACQTRCTKDIVVEA